MSNERVAVSVGTLNVAVQVDIDFDAEWTMKKIVFNSFGRSTAVAKASFDTCRWTRSWCRSLIIRRHSFMWIIRRWQLGADVKVRWYGMVISLEISFRFAGWGTALNIFGQAVPENGCGWGKKTRIHKVLLREMGLGVRVEGVCGKDLWLRLVKAAMV